MNPYIAAAAIGILAFIAGSHPRYFSPDKTGYDVGYDFSDKKVIDGYMGEVPKFDGYFGDGTPGDGYFGNGKPN